MRTFITNSLVIILLPVIVLAALFSTAHSQSRGDYRFASPPAVVIEQTLRYISSPDSSGAEKMASVFPQKFVSSVGGISFGQTAVMASTLPVKSWNISYSREKSDGERLVLILNGQAVNFRIFDWMLIPIAKYADSDYTSCFTYFGKLKDKNMEQTVLENGGHVLNYHPAFQNTLLGWRLADMDMLILYDFTTDLPKVNNKYILGAGESQPNLNANQYGAYKFTGYVREIEEKLGYPFQSYILTDYSREIKCTVQNDTLTITGYPYYYCWVYRNSEPGFDMKARSTEIRKGYEETIRQRTSGTGEFDIREFYIDSLIEIVKRYEAGYNLYQSGTINELTDIRQDGERKAFLRRYTTESLNTMAIEVTVNMEAQTPVFLKTFSDKMSAFPDLIKACNPEVWNATVTTLRVSAFFRYLKEFFPEEWRMFIASVQDVNPLPKVTTPTVIYSAGDKILEPLFR
jgi:hypothetical protein